ncbi:MAG TPA: EamA family transporter [Leptolyngbyaceae cyanobacterium]
MSPTAPSASPAQTHRLAFLALLLLAVIWGYNWVVMKIAVRDSPPFDFAALRDFWGSLSLFLLMVVLRKPLRPQALWGTALFGLLQSGASIGFLTWALVEGGAGKTSILTYTMAFWTLLFAWIFLGERLRGQQWFGVGLALIGLLFILMPFSFSSDLVSKGLAVLAGIFWAIASIVSKKLNQAQSLDLLSFTAWQMLFGSLPLVIVSLVLPSPPIHWSGSFVAALLYNVIPGSAIAWLLWLYALKHLPAGLAGLGGLITPIVGTLAASLQLGEIPSSTEVLGIIMILLALVLTTLQIKLKPLKML